MKLQTATVSVSRLLEGIPAHIAYGAHYAAKGMLKQGYAPLDAAEAAEWAEDIDTLRQSGDEDIEFRCVCGHHSYFHPGLRRAHKKCLDAYKELHP